MKRRRFIVGAAAGCIAWTRTVRQAAAQSEDLAAMHASLRAEARAAIDRVTRGATPVRGRVEVDLPPLVENGNVVPLTVTVASPMTESDHVRALHVFAELNPQPFVAVFRFGPRAGHARVSTRIRLNNSQTLLVLCEMSDGSWWSGTAEVIVTLAACTDVL